jgi:hypothetical protein
MNQLIAKIRDRNRNSNKYRKVLSDEALFSLSDTISDVTEYSPNTILESGQWFVIDGFASKEYCLDFLKDETFSSVDYEQLEVSEFDKLDFLFSYQDGIFFFQNISKSQLVRKKLLSFGERFKYDSNNASITIKDVADAICDKSTDKLYFRVLSSITSIFHGIDQLHREATEEETVEFLKNDFIVLTNGFSSSDVKTSNRKRIVLALDTLKTFTAEDKQAVLSYISDYYPNLSASGDTFSIGSENELKTLLFGIEQRFYTTPVGEEKRIANSVVKIGD